MIISIDAGKGFTKYCYEKDNKIVANKFITKYTDLTKSIGVNLFGDESFEVRYADVDYEIGLNGKKDMREDGTDKKQFGHRLAMLTAIGKVLIENEIDETDVYICLSMPSEVYRNNVNKEEYRSYFLGDSEGKETITIDNKDVSFTIKQLLMSPEGVGYIINEDEEIEGDTLIVDIGHLNTHLIQLKNSTVTNMLTNNSGGAMLENDVNAKLRENNLDPDPDYIFKYIQEGCLRDDNGEPAKGTEEIISEVLTEYVDNVVKDIINRGINLAMQDRIVFVGGTSLLLKKYIENHPKIKNRVKVSSDAIYDTVKGNLILGSAVIEQGNNGDE